MLYSCFPLAAIASNVFYKAEQNGHNPSLTQSIPVKFQNGTLSINVYKIVPSYLFFLLRKEWS